MWSHAGAVRSWGEPWKEPARRPRNTRQREMPGVSGKQGMEQDWTDLPASVVGQPGNLHSMGRSTRARRGAFVTTTEAFFVAVSAGELDGEALSHEDSSILVQSVRTSITGRTQGGTGRGYGQKVSSGRGKSGKRTESCAGRMVSMEFQSVAKETTEKMGQFTHLGRHRGHPEDPRTR